VKAKHRIERLRTLLAEIGLEPERVRMFNVSSAMAGQFATAATEMTNTIQSLGPNPLKKKLKERPS